MRWFIHISYTHIYIYICIYLRMYVYIYICLYIIYICVCVIDCRSQGPCRDCSLQRPPGLHEPPRKCFSEFPSVFFGGERFSERFEHETPAKDKRGVRKRFATVIVWFAKNGHLQIKELRSTAIFTCTYGYFIIWEYNGTIPEFSYRLVMLKNGMIMILSGYIRARGILRKQKKMRGTMKRGKWLMNIYYCCIWYPLYTMVIYCQSQS